jgi:hypothetical protein
VSAEYHTFTNYLEAVFFAYMHEHSICPLTHEGISFYFGEIYEHGFDRKTSETTGEFRADLHFLVDDARELQANGVRLGFNRGIPHIHPYQPDNDDD